MGEINTKSLKVVLSASAVAVAALAVDALAFSTPAAASHGEDAAIAAPSAADQTLNALFDEIRAYELSENPLSATFAGKYDWNDRLPSVAPEDYARRTEARAAFRDRLIAIDRDALSEEGRLNADLADFILRHQIAQAPFKTWRVPFLADSGFHSSVVFAMKNAPLRSKKDYEDYIARMQALPAYLDQNVANMRIGVADGFTQPKEILPFIVPSFEALANSDPEAHPLFAPFAGELTGVSDRAARGLKRKARAAMTKDVLPAYGRVLSFIKDEYMPNAADNVGASNLPDGEAYYEEMIAFYTSLDGETADSVHQLGLSEVARIRAEMDVVIEQTGFEGSFKEFQEFLRTDPQFYAKTADELLREAAWISKDIDGRLPKFFGKLPRQPYSVEPVPAEIAPNYTTGRYVGAPLGGDRGGQYWVNTYALDKRPLYQLTALSLHEAVPGHHMQSALAKEIENVPAFRNGFYPHAFGEGWGLYSEKLGVEMGVYNTPYEHFGRLSYEMWRACRLVIDTGLHAKGWTRSQAIDYLASNTALSLLNVQTEVDRYIAWPGQALAYKMGELKIWELRAKAEKELGDDFDIRAFHDAVLANGGLPLELLSDEIDAYIAAAKED